MSFTWNHVLDLARHLSQMDHMEMASDPEAYYRSSVSRSYYACHTAVRDWLATNAQYSYNQNSGVGVHKDVIDKTKDLISPTTSHYISRQLDNLRAERVEADYELLPLTGLWDKSRAENAIIEAEAILERLSRSVRQT